MSNDIALYSFNELEKLDRYIKPKLLLAATNYEPLQSLIKAKKQRDDFVSRFFDGLTGRAKREQDAINEYLSEGLKACGEWLRDHDGHLRRIDESIIELAQTLGDVINGANRLYDMHMDLRSEFDKFKELVDERFKSVEYRLDKAEAKNKIDVLVEGISVFEGDDIIFEIYQVLDELKNGEFGAFLSRSATKDDKNELLNYLQNKLKSALKTREIIRRSALIERFNALSQAKKDIGKLSSGLTLMQAKSAPSSMLIHLLSDGSDEALKQLDEDISITRFVKPADFAISASREHFRWAI